MKSVQYVASGHDVANKKYSKNINIKSMKVKKKKKNPAILPCSAISFLGQIHGYPAQARCASRRARGRGGRGAQSERKYRQVFAGAAGPSRSLLLLLLFIFFRLIYFFFAFLLS